MRNTKQFLALLIITLLLISCDKDYNALGSGLVNQTHFNATSDSDFIVETSNIKFETGNNPVQTNNLPYNLLGVYDDSVYGKTTANLLAQLSMTSYDPFIGDNPVIEEVILSVPYFSTRISTDESGDSEYELDSIYGNGEIDLSIYRSGYYLNNFDPDSDFEENQEYFSDQSPTFNSNTLELLYQDSNFTPDSNEISVEVLDSEGVSTTNKLSPSLRVVLDNSHFSWLFAPENSDALLSDANFKNYYRGLYFKTDQGADVNNVLFGLNLSQGTVTIAYKHDINVTAEDGTVSVVQQESELILNFNGGKVNTFDNIDTYVEDADKLYLKGMQGSMVAIDLFGPDADADDVSDQLEGLRLNDWLINEANLEFYVATSSIIGGESEPERISIYDMKNNSVLADYFFDSSSGVDEKSIHLGKLERDELGNGIKYKINITEHIRALIKEDTENVRLGLVVSNNVTLLNYSSIENSVDPLPTKTLSSSVLSHKGTVLYNEHATGDKKLKLTIHYTEEVN